MKHKSFKKRFLALVSCLALMAASPLAVMADGETIDTTKTGALHITKYDMTAAEAEGKKQSVTNGAQNTTAESDLAAYALENVEFSYLKVADINQVTSASAQNPATDASVQVTYTIPENLDKILCGKKTDHTYTSTELNSMLQNALTNNKKNALEDYLSTGGTKMTKTDAQGQTTASGLPLGLYLVVETSVPADVKSTTDPFFVSLPMTNAAGTQWLYDVYVYPKNQTGQPTLEKKVKRYETGATFADTTSADIGSKVEYRIVSRLPEITTKATYLTKYTYVDTLAAGLTYDDDVSIKFYSDQNLTNAANVTFTKDTDYTVNYDNTQNKMTITMTTGGLEKMNPALSLNYMAITYKATVNNAAVLGDGGNLNQVVLTYGRSGAAGLNPGANEEKDITDGAKVYTYGINLEKKFSQAGGDATAVKFTLKEGNNSIYATGSKGVYTVCAAGTAGAVTEFSPAADGTLKIKGLKGAAYTMTETATSAGYMLLKEPLNIVITESSATITPVEGDQLTTVVADRTASATVNRENASMDEDGNTSLNAWVKLAVTNTKGFELPKTGGLGTILFTAIGAAGLALCIILFTRKRRTEDK